MSLDLQASFLQGMHVGGGGRTGKERAVGYRQLYNELKAMDNGEGDKNPSKDKVAFSQQSGGSISRDPLSFADDEYRARATKLKGDSFQIELYSLSGRNFEEYERVTVTPENVTILNVDTLGVTGADGYIAVLPNKNTERMKHTALEVEDARLFLAEGIVSTANARR